MNMSQTARDFFKERLVEFVTIAVAHLLGLGDSSMRDVLGSLSNGDVRPDHVSWIAAELEHRLKGLSFGTLQSKYTGVLEKLVLSRHLLRAQRNQNSRQNSFPFFEFYHREMLSIMESVRSDLVSEDEKQRGEIKLAQDLILEVPQKALDQIEKRFPHFVRTLNDQVRMHDLFVDDFVATVQEQFLKEEKGKASRGQQEAFDQLLKKYLMLLHGTKCNIEKVCHWYAVLECNATGFASVLRIIWVTSLCVADLSLLDALYSLRDLEGFEKQMHKIAVDSLFTMLNNALQNNQGSLFFLFVSLLFVVYWMWDSRNVRVLN